MALNPFGEESDSVHAWKERFKQQQFQTQTLSQELGQVKSQLQDIQVKYEEVTRQLSDRESELSSAKQELANMRTGLKEREQKILKLESSLDSDRVSRLEEENQQLKLKLENLQSEIHRGGGSQKSSNSSSSSDEITSAIIPLLLHEFDRNNSRYQNAVENFVETVINHGDPLGKTISVLIKYGGRGPEQRVRELVNEPNFDMILEILIEEGIIVKIDDELHIAAGEFESAFDENEWKEASVDNLFDTLMVSADSQDNDNLIKSLEKFRDILQEKEIPLTTIFFEIRKTTERIQKGLIDRDEVKEIINTWHEKYKALT